MPKKTKDQIIQELQQELVSQYKKSNELIENADNEFVNSSLRKYIESEREFYKRLYETNQNLYRDLKIRFDRQKETFQSLFEDNKMFARVNDMTYDIGMFCRKESYDDNELLEENKSLKAEIDCNKETIELLMNEIEDCRRVNVELQIDIEKYSNGQIDYVPHSRGKGL
ncbi:MAG TPA: hypothetical protein VHQ24_08290 [Lachnospiraceae bacterium]|nr:hypothetical protein [Lachnospiraceae bacterium]